MVAAETEGLMVPKVKLELAAPVDVAAIERELDTTGSSTIPVRGQTITLDLYERDLFGPHGREVYEVAEGGTATLVGRVTARPLAGAVRDVEPSLVVVTVDAGTKSLFGTISMNERVYSLVGEPNEEGQTILKTIWNENIRPTPEAETALHGGISLLSASKDTYIRVFSDQNFRNYASNWQTRITNAFNEQHAMWDSQTDIHQYHGPFTGITGAWSSDCSTHLSSFRSDVQSGIDSGIYYDDAYQLFTGVDLSDCYGMAYAATPGNTLTLATSSAASILEAVDHSCCDKYDPDESDDLGLVSGQEIAHNYGEEDHPQEDRCESYFLGACTNETYNIMATGTDHDGRNFWFTSGSSSDSAERILTEGWPQL